MSDSPVPLEAPRRLRIAVLNRVFDPAGGGAERYSIALVEQLAQRHEIHVFAQQIRHHAPGVTYHLVSMPLRKPRWLNQLWYATATWWATRRGFDVVHSHKNTWQGQVQTVHVLPVKYNLFHGRTGWRRVLAWAKVWSSPRL
ncbi:MAG: glycosyltransferase, partial [Polaromonas sp.]|nr:glycosyltransferase [Polaromonas sp.]